MDKKLKCIPCNLSFKNQTGLDYHEGKFHLNKTEIGNAENCEQSQDVKDEGEEFDIDDINIIECTLDEIIEKSEHKPSQEDFQIDNRVTIPNVEINGAETHKEVSEQLGDDLGSYGENCYDRNENGEYACNYCGKIFTKRHKMKRHWDEVHTGIKYPCDQCSFMSKRKEKLNNHIKKKHPVSV